MVGGGLVALTYCVVFRPASCKVKTTLLTVPGANVSRSLLAPWLMRAKMTGPELSGWSQPSHAPNDCARMPKVPEHAAGVGFDAQLAAPMKPPVWLHVISNWAIPLVSAMFGSPHHIVAGQPAVPGLCSDVEPEEGSRTQELVVLFHVCTIRPTLALLLMLTPLPKATPASTVTLQPPTLRYWVPLAHEPLTVTPSELICGGTAPASVAPDADAPLGLIKRSPVFVLSS